MENDDFPPALQVACANGDLDRAKSTYDDFIKNNPSARMSLLTKMAIASARNAHPPILSFCFASGLTQRKFDCNDSILYAACDASAIPIFAVLLDEGGLDVNHWLECSGDVLKVAVEHGNTELVKYLFSKGADANSDRCAPHGDNTAIIWAIVGDRNQQSTEMLRILFEHGTKLEGTGALIAAAEHGNLEAVKLLFDMKGNEVDLEEETEEGLMDPRVRADDGTALYKAAAGGHAEIVDILVRKGADIGFKDPSGRSVVDIARVKGHREIATRLGQLISLPAST
ncbi:MAG: hypothetical protein Q9193_002055 [Seirophora villosa]